MWPLAEERKRGKRRGQERARNKRKKQRERKEIIILKKLTREGRKGRGKKK